MEDKEFQRLYLNDLIPYQPDEQTPLWDMIQQNGLYQPSTVKHHAHTSQQELLTSSIVLDPALYGQSWSAQNRQLNFAAQATQSYTQDKSSRVGQKPIIRTLIAYAANSPDATTQRVNLDYRNRLSAKLNSISKQICELDITWHKADEQDLSRVDELELSRLILLLLDDSFINTEYCRCPKLCDAVERHNENRNRVIPIHLQQCLITANLPFFNLDICLSKSMAVSSLKNKSKVFDDIQKTIIIAVEFIRDKILPSIGY